MRNILKIAFLLLLFLLPILVHAEQERQSEFVLKASVSVDKVPKGFFGTWKVTSTQISTTNPFLNTGTSTDYWTILRVGEILTLANPASGARASVTLQSVRGNTIKFEKISKDYNDKSIETPTIKLTGNDFTGTDTVIIETYKYGEIIKTDKIEYKIRGEKLSGSTIKELFNIGN